MRSTLTAVSYTAAEVASQPRVWREAASLAGPDFAKVLMEPGPLAVVGCGTSWFVAQVLATLREDAELGPTDAFSATEARLERDYPSLLALSRSGTTSEICQLLDRRSAHTRATAVVAVPDSPAAQAADEVIAMAFADEQSVVQTRFATTVVVAARAALGHDVESLAVAAEAVLGQPVPAVAVEARQVVFLGTGWSIGIAHEAALKLREATLSWSESYPAMEFRHGPIALAEPGTVVWIFGAAPVGLVDDIAATGAAVVDDDLDPVVDLVRVHMLALERARRRGLDPDRPRNLTRSVILDR